MITHNHASFIARALDSALAQATNFQFEIVVSDDASTDGTSAIVRRYAERHPDVIRPVLRDANVGMNRNFIDTLKACRREYVAFLEGDDYWDSPRKLQTQVEVLDADRAAVLCCHPVKIVAADGERLLGVTPADPRDVLSIEDVVLYRYPLPTCATVVRNVLREVPPWFYEIYSLDYATQLMIARYGSVRIVHETMAVYRKHDAGISESIPTEQQIDYFIHLLECANAELGFAYDRLFRRRLSMMYRGKTKVEMKKHRFGAAARAAWDCARYFATSTGALAKTA
jgi:glycosyltransferase involved in cell wall biosynthesis